ncbi:hypothetical protein WJX73_000397 [Symbiochloris irregularis]|uniref:Uncharacterized protein n=1 Tax=Symbiochloris irregularis TaxID=706552 RepID=A0AAW1PAI5_9CHLO
MATGRVRWLKGLQPAAQAAQQPLQWFRTSKEQDNTAVLQVFVPAGSTVQDYAGLELGARQELVHSWQAGAGTVIFLVLKQALDGSLHISDAVACTTYATLSTIKIQVHQATAARQPRNSLPQTLEVKVTRIMNGRDVDHRADRRKKPYYMAAMRTAAKAVSYLSRPSSIDMSTAAWRGKLQSWFGLACKAAEGQALPDNTVAGPEGEETSDEEDGQPQANAGPSQPATSNVQPGVEGTSNSVPGSSTHPQHIKHAEAGTAAATATAANGPGQATQHVAAAAASGGPAATDSAGAVPATAADHVPENHAAGPPYLPPLLRFLSLLSVAVLLLGVCWGGYAGYQMYTGLKEQVKELNATIPFQQNQLRVYEDQLAGQERKLVKAGKQAKSDRQHLDDAEAERGAAKVAEQQAAVRSAELGPTPSQAPRRAAAGRPVGFCSHLRALVVVLVWTMQCAFTGVQAYIHSLGWPARTLLALLVCCVTFLVRGAALYAGDSQAWRREGPICMLQSRLRRFAWREQCLKKDAREAWYTLGELQEQADMKTGKAQQRAEELQTHSGTVTRLNRRMAFDLGFETLNAALWKAKAVQLDCDSRVLGQQLGQAQDTAREYAILMEGAQQDAQRARAGEARDLLYTTIEKQRDEIAILKRLNNAQCKVPGTA